MYLLAQTMYAQEFGSAIAVEEHLLCENFTARLSSGTSSGVRKHQVAPV